MKGNEKMTKNEMIKKIQEVVEIEIPMKDIDAILKAQEVVARNAVKEGDDITIPGIGKISVKDVPERRGTIMMGERKGEEYVVEAHREPKMKLAKGFKDCLL